jgi:hypothetical protein
MKYLKIKYDILFYKSRVTITEPMRTLGLHPTNLTRTVENLYLNYNVLRDKIQQ